MSLIIYSNKNPLILRNLAKEFDIKQIKDKQGFFESIFAKKITSIDLSFCYDTKNINLKYLKISKIILATSKRIKAHLTNEGIEEKKIDVLYPTFSPREIKLKESRKKLFEILKIKDKKQNIITFRANNLKKSGAKEFVDIIRILKENNFLALLCGEQKQIETLKFQIAKHLSFKNLILLEDFSDLNMLYCASDIFILPSHLKTFSLDALKAMYYNCGVFITRTNDASEILDVFSTLGSPEDENTEFKISALLSSEDNDLEKIKKTNHKIAKKYILSEGNKRLKIIISSLQK